MNDLEILNSASEAPAAPAVESTPSTPVSDAPASDAPVASTPPVVDAPAVDAPPADAPVVEPPVAEEPIDDELELMPQAAAEDPLSVKALNEKIAKNPEFKASLDKDPGLRNLLYATARQAQQATQFKEIFQTPAMAQTALSLANKQIEFESSFGAERGKGLEAIYGVTAQRDAEGNILWDQPNPQFDETLKSQREDYLWPHGLQAAIAAGAQQIQLSNGVSVAGEDLRDALAIVAAYFGDKIESDSPFAKIGAKPQPQAQDPETTARLARLDQLESQQTQHAQQQQQQYQDGIRTGIHDKVTGAAKQYLDNALKATPNAAITDFVKTSVIEKAVQEIYSLAQGDQSYKTHISFLARTTKQDQDGSTKIINEAAKYARERLPRLVAKYISEASKGVVAAQAARLEKQSAQSRPEVQGSAGVASPSQPEPAERVKAFIKKNGHRPTDRQLFDDSF